MGNVMKLNTDADDGRTDGGDTRFDDDNLSLADVREAKQEGGRVRIARDAVTSQPNAVATGRAAHEVDGVEAVLYASQFNDHTERAILYDSEAELYAVVSGHTRSEAWNTVEHDWKVRSIGSTLSAEFDAEDFDSEEEGELWAEWVLSDLVQYGEDGGIYAVYPDGAGFEIVTEDSGVEGLIGDRFTLEITAEDDE